MPAFAKQLKYERERCSWSQEQLAELIGTTPTNVSRWERGLTLPKPYFRQKLCELFGKNAEELGLLEASPDTKIPPPDQSGAPPSHPSPRPEAFPLRWHLPHQRNPLFTGREELLVRLYRTLNTGAPVALTQVQALSGLGGIGKTQTAIEYAYRYSDRYQAILWLRGEARDVLFSDMLTLAEAFHLNKQGEETQKQQSAIEAIKGWLQEHSGWLLIIDNLEELALLREVLPAQSSGHIILTTRVQSTGPRIQRIDLEKMEPDEGALFLLRRAKRIGPHDTFEHASLIDGILARAISQCMDGLPLALDQAGAYIEETGCSLAHYLDLFQSHHAVLLGLRDLSSGINADHPLSVRATLSLSLEQIKQANPAALDLLRLCAFLDADAIPEELLFEGGDALYPDPQEGAFHPLTLDAAIAGLRRYSLLQRNPQTQTLSLHRLVQVVVKDSMDEDMQRQWALRALQMVNRVFPRVERWVTSSQCQRYFPHAQVCAALIEAWDILCPEAGQLLTRLASYLFELGEYEFTLLTQTEPLLRRALTLLTHATGSVYLEAADAHQMLGRLCNYRWNAAQAVWHLQQALEIHDQMQQPEQRSIRECLTFLADIYLELEGKHAQAEPLYRRALEISEQLREPEHLDVAIDTYNLGVCYHAQKRYAQAEPLLERALDMCQRALGMEHPITSAMLHSLGRLYMDQNQDAQAEPLLERALEIRQKVLKPGHLHTAISLMWLGKLHLRHKQYAQAGPLLQQALDMCQQAVGMEHPITAGVLHTLGRFSLEQGQRAQAEPLLRQAFEICQKVLGAEHPDTVAARNDLDKLGARPQPT